MSGPALVVAVGNNGVIGKDGDLPWRIREDLQHFKRVTMGHAIIMGRRTWDSIGRPLPGRRSIVVTRNQDFEAPGATVVHSLPDAIAAARDGGDDSPCIIGGASLYEEGLALAQRIHWTEVDREVDGDTFFPAWDRSGWVQTERVAGQTAGVTFCVWERVGGR